ncbi:hypothetical protein NFI96_019085 [Prochilodus magdalenae]|nr:hypothetical protein NFI96_019085 [Prochilodus magdalenae]
MDGWRPSFSAFDEVKGSHDFFYDRCMRQDPHRTTTEQGVCGWWIILRTAVTLTWWWCVSVCGAGVSGSDTAVLLDISVLLGLRIDHCGLWGSVLWAVSCGQLPVGSVLWAASCGQRPVGSVLCPLIKD